MPAQGKGLRYTPGGGGFDSGRAGPKMKHSFFGRAPYPMKNSFPPGDARCADVCAGMSRGKPGERGPGRLGRQWRFTSAAGPSAP